ncbi:MAG: RluA family pseudouridine synthase [Patescibacteria group bacterium]
MNTNFVHNSAPERLDTALAKELAISRAKAQRLIKDGRVLIDGQVPKAHVMLATGTKVNITPEPADTHTAAEAPALEVLFENADVLVINKPAGLLVHPTLASKEVTLLDSILNYDPKIAEVGDDKQRSGIVHRLDREASGVMVIARNNATFQNLKEQFKQRLTEKHYTVLVLGKVQEDFGTINFPIARSSTRSRMAARPTSQEGKEAITHYAVTQRFTASTLLDVHIETGRTHQIRAHFFALGHPVAGDKLYLRRDLKPLKTPRLFLHASSLSLTLPDGERITVTAPLPDVLVQTLAALKPVIKT